MEFQLCHYNTSVTKNNQAWIEGIVTRRTEEVVLPLLSCTRC